MRELAIKEPPAPQPYARLGGLLYVVIIILGVSSEFFFRGRLMVAGNATATAANIQASPLLWRLGIMAEYISIVCTIILAMIYYFLLTPVHRNGNLLATFFRLISITVQVVAVLHLVEAQFYLEPSSAVATFTPAQRAALVALAIKAHSYGYGISLFFLGWCFLVHGYLIYRSGFLPRVLGGLIQVAGLCYIANGGVLLLAPAAAKVAFQVFFLPVFVAETSLGLWLLLKGVRVEQWKARYAQRV